MILQYVYNTDIQYFFGVLQHTLEVIGMSLSIFFFLLFPIILLRYNRNIYLLLQMDRVVVDLGQVVNAGFSKKWGGNKPEHNTLAIKVSTI